MVFKVDYGKWYDNKHWATINNSKVWDDSIKVKGAKAIEGLTRSLALKGSRGFREEDNRSAKELIEWLVFDTQEKLMEEIEEELIQNIDTYAMIRRNLGLSKFILFYSKEIVAKETFTSVEASAEIRYSLYEHINGQRPELIY